MGVLLGVYISFFARKYADDELKQSKRNRDQYSVIIRDDGA